MLLENMDDRGRDGEEEERGNLDLYLNYFVQKIPYLVFFFLYITGQDFGLKKKDVHSIASLSLSFGLMHNTQVPSFSFLLFFFESSKILICITFACLKYVCDY